MNKGQDVLMIQIHIGGLKWLVVDHQVQLLVNSFQFTTSRWNSTFSRLDFLDNIYLS